MAIPIQSAPNYKPEKATKLKAKQALTAKQQLAVALVAEGRTELSIANELKISERTVRNWKALPPFKALLEKILADRFMDEKPIMAKLRRDALMGMEKLIQYGSFKAMEAILKMTTVKEQLAPEENIPVQFGPPLDADALARLKGTSGAGLIAGDSEATGNNNPSS